MERTRGAYRRTSASSARGSWPGNRRVNELRDLPAIVDWVLLPAARRAHVYALGDCIEGLQHLTAGMGYLRDCLQFIENYNSDSSNVCSEEEVGDDEDEDGAWLVSTQYVQATADISRTDTFSALILHLRPPFCLLRVFRKCCTAAP